MTNGSNQSIFFFTHSNQASNSSVRPLFDEVDVYSLTDEFAIALKGQDELIALYKALPIAWMEHIHAGNFLPMLNELPIEEELFAEGAEEEHTESFYKRWKLAELITLKRVPLIKGGMERAFIARRKSAKLFGSTQQKGHF